MFPFAVDYPEVDTGGLPRGHPRAEKVAADRVTFVLYKCHSIPCDHLATRTIEGRWTLEQVRRREDATG